MAVFTALFQEIYNAIVDCHCHPHDKKFLLSCTLAHRSLRHRAQAYLFASIRVRNSDRLDELQELMNHKERIAQHVTSITTLSEFLIDVYSPLVGILKQLNRAAPEAPLQISLGTGGIRDTDSAYDVEYVLPVKDLLGLLRRVNELQIRDVAGLPAAVISGCPRLRSLAFHDSALDMAINRADVGRRPYIIHLSSKTTNFEEIRELHEKVANLSMLEIYECSLVSEYWRPAVDGIQYVLDASQQSLIELHQHALLKPEWDHSYTYSLRFNNSIEVLKLEIVNFGEEWDISAISYLNSILAKINPVLNVLQKVEFSIQVELDDLPPSDINSRTIPNVGTPPELFVDEEAVEDWVEFFRLLTRVARGRALDVVFKVLGGIHPDRSEIYTEPERTVDGRKLARTMQAWVDTHAAILKGSMVRLECNAEVIFMDKDLYYVDSDLESIDSEDMDID